MKSSRRFGAAAEFAQRRHGEPETASTRWTVSGSQNHASSVATTVMAAAAQIGAV